MPRRGTQNEESNDMPGTNHHLVHGFELQLGAKG
jgi:hypothetical protein